MAPADRTRTGRTAAPLRETKSLGFPLTLSPVRSSSATCSGTPEVPYAPQHLGRFRPSESGFSDARHRVRVSSAWKDSKSVRGPHVVYHTRCCSHRPERVGVLPSERRSFPDLRVLTSPSQFLLRTSVPTPPEVAEVSTHVANHNRWPLAFSFRSFVHLQ